METTIQLKLYNLLRKDLNISDEVAQEFVQTLEDIVSKETEQSRKEVATKDFVDKKVTEAKNDIIKWFVGIFITLALMIIGLYIK